MTIALSIRPLGCYRFALCAFRAGRLVVLLEGDLEACRLALRALGQPATTLLPHDVAARAA